MFEKDGVYTGRKYVLEVDRDEDAESPRTWGNLGTMVCWHKRYNLGDKHDFGSPWDFLGEVNEKDAFILPIHMYEHGGIVLATGNGGYPFNDPWDAGQVGWVYVTKEKVREEWGCQRITQKVKDHVIACLEGEVEVYGQYVNGDVWEFRLYERCPLCRREEEGEELDESIAGFHESHCDGTGDLIDSCCGFYGYDPLENGMAEHLRDEVLVDLGLKKMELAVA